jgi:hypothetical protein
MMKKACHAICLIQLLFIVTQLQAGTICAHSCPPDPTDPSADLPVIGEILSLGNVDLLIRNSGIILLDIDLYNNHENLSIEPSSPLYFGLAAVPESLNLPGAFELAQVSIQDGSISLIDSGADDVFFLLRQFDNTDQLILSAPYGIIILDTDTLFATPVPASTWLFSSGLAMLLVAVRRKI